MYYKSGNSFKTLPIKKYESNATSEITFSCIQAGEELIIELLQNSCFAYQINCEINVNTNYNEIEPNDSRSTAQIFNADETINGQISYGQTSTFSNNNDYFKIPVTFNTPLKIDLSIVNGVSLFLYESDKSGYIEFIKQTNSTGPISTFSHNNVDSNKEYYLHIAEFSGFCSDYILSGWSQGFSYTNDSEPNNSIEKAINLDLTQAYSGQLNYVTTPQDSEDFYSFILNETDDIEFVLNASEGLIGTATLTVFDSNNSQIYQLIHDGNNSSTSSKSFTKNTKKLEAGTYYLAISEADETGSYEFKVIPQNTLSTTDYNLDNYISIYPNPATDMLSVKTEKNLDDLYFSIFDITGKYIISKNKLENNKEIDISNLESGIYFIQIKSGNNLINKRFVKK